MVMYHPRTMSRVNHQRASGLEIECAGGQQSVVRSLGADLAPRDVVVFSPVFAGTSFVPVGEHPHEPDGFGSHRGSERPVELLLLVNVPHLAAPNESRASQEFGIFLVKQRETRQHVFADNLEELARELGGIGLFADPVEEFHGVDSQRCWIGYFLVVQPAQEPPDARNARLVRKHRRVPELELSVGGGETLVTVARFSEIPFRGRRCERGMSELLDHVEG